MLFEPVSCRLAGPGHDGDFHLLDNLPSWIAPGVAGVGQAGNLPGDGRQFIVTGGDGAPEAI